MHEFALPESAFGGDQLTVEQHVELAEGALLDRARRIEALAQLVRQLVGAAAIAARLAVEDPEVHPRGV